MARAASASAPRRVADGARTMQRASSGTSLAAASRPGNGDRGSCQSIAMSRPRTPFVSVAIRVRPNFTNDAVAIWAKSTPAGEPRRRVCCHRGYLLEEYEFSRVFGPEDDNANLFQDLQGPALAASVFGGVNETLFAYGQTGSGKTHSIFGSGQEYGLLQLFVRQLFEQAEVNPGSTVHACCYEVLGESLTDLIDSKALIEEGLLQEEDVVFDELYIKTQRCHYQIVRVGSAEVCLDLLQEARLNRTSGVSSYNSDSSRSHAVVHLFVQNPTESWAENGQLGTSIGALTLVDLAGTEKEHENPSERGRKSARLLNTSLSSLNRLLRKLQTGSLDESERRQSVLNKCLWEYLRPGCGITLIFCASPLAQHRAASLSTLAMATDSKLINSTRKSQFIQIPGRQSPQQQHQPTPVASPACRGGACGKGWNGGQSWQANPPLTPPLPRGANRTPRTQNTGGGRTPSSAGTARGKVDFCLTPRTRENAVVSPTCQEPAFELNSLADVEKLCGGGDLQQGVLPAESPSQTALRSLAAQNSKLRRKLGRARARSQEHVSRVERERDQLISENVALRSECESLRALFIRQQQQQIAFWTGPFMDLMESREVGGSAAAVSAAAAAQAAAEAASVAGGSPRPTLPAPSPPRGSPPPSSSKKAVDESQETLAPACDDNCCEDSPSVVPSTTASLPENARARFLEVSTTGTSLSSLSGARGRSACGESPEVLRCERDYWRELAASLQRGLPQRVLASSGQTVSSATACKEAAGGVRQESELSTSSQRGCGSERSRSNWSDSSSSSSESVTREQRLHSSRRPPG
eukprot:TRINITY_DN22347_c0_g1_i2.p1 TRINITY_DN22347_c0_g1~~TRINITY_DN22347_c0_g1_i2.p1  ORF type:complete len:811 (+),score=139.44 TRINITY_DN22347_c0_g1_i2:93-2525(+)